MGNMKYLFSLLAAFLLCQYGAWAQGNTYVDDYYCGFDTQEEFDEWTVETKVGAAAWTWQSGGYVEFNTANDMFNDHDAWMFSPKITISNPESPDPNNSGGAYRFHALNASAEGNIGSDVTPAQDNRSASKSSFSSPRSYLLYV